jgi:hypothetical protein
MFDATLSSLLFKSNQLNLIGQFRCLSLTQFLNKYRWIYRKQDIDKSKDFASDYTYRGPERKINFKEPLITSDIELLRQKYSEFLPNADLKKRNKVKDNLGESRMF